MIESVGKSVVDQIAVFR